MHELSSAGTWKVADNRNKHTREDANEAENPCTRRKRHMSTAKKKHQKCC